MKLIKMNLSSELRPSWIGLGFTVILLSISFKGQAQNPPQYSYQGATTIANSIPFASAATGNNKRQWIFYPSNFTGAPAGYINKIYLKASAVVSPSFTGFLIRMGNTTLSTFPSTTFITGLDTVLNASSISLSTITSNWIPITLQTPFFYNGTSNFVVEASHQGYSPGFSVLQSTITARSLYGNSGSATGSSQDRLADFGFDLVPGSHDIGLEGFVNLADTVCQGSTPISVQLKNHGTNNLASAKIGWKVNNIPQPTFNWSGSIAPNATSTVTIGNFLFNYGTSYAIQAYAYEPNGGTDSIHGNDTIVKPEVITKPSPTFSPNDTLYTICPGDSVLINSVLTGSPPWNLILSDGTTPLNYNNITSSSFSFTLKPALTTQYTFTSLSDVSGCVNVSGPGFSIVVLTAPPAVITPVGSTAACAGDSVTLMASIGLNFQYQWYKDGVPDTTSSTYVLSTQQSGAYSVMVTSVGGCSSTSVPVNVFIHPLPVVTLGNDTAVLPGTTLMLDAGPGFSSYLWSTGATTQQILADNTGTGIGVKTFWVQVTDNNGCKGTDTIRINFTPGPGIEEMSGPTCFKVIPNPSDGRIELQWIGVKPETTLIEVYSTNGVCVYRQQIQPGDLASPFLLDLSHLSGGSYQLKGTSGVKTMYNNILIIK